MNVIGQPEFMDVILLIRKQIMYSLLRQIVYTTRYAGITRAIKSWQKPD